jgi:hypothetical protein
MACRGRFVDVWQHVEATQIAVALLQIKVLMSPQPWRAGILQRS